MKTFQVNHAQVPFTYKKKQLYAEIYITYMPETESVEGNFAIGNEEENKAYLARFESGALLNVALTVEARFKGFEGYARLGMCHVSAQGLAGELARLVDDHGLVWEALEDLISHIAHMETVLAEINKA
jgi:hypothetical protein